MLAHAGIGKAIIEIIATAIVQLIELVFKEVVRTFDGLMVDGNALLRLQLVDERLHILLRDYLVFVTMDHETG